jgi:hypothetical protein
MTRIRLLNDPRTVRRTGNEVCITAQQNNGVHSVVECVHQYRDGDVYVRVLLLRPLESALAMRANQFSLLH